MNSSTFSSSPHGAVTRSEAIQAIVFMAITALGLAGIWRLGTHFDPPYPEAQRQAEQLLARADVIELLVAGNSHALSVDVAALGYPDTGYLYWVPGADIQEVRYLLRAVMPKLPKLHTIAVNVSLGTLYQDNMRQRSDANPDVAPKARRSFYHAVPSRFWVPGDFRHYVRAHLSPLIKPDHWVVAAREILELLTIGGENERDGLYAVDSLGRRIDETGELERTGEYLWVHAKYMTAPSHRLLVEQVRENQPELPAMVAKQIEGLIRDAQACDVRIVLFTVPVFHPLLDLLDASAINELRTKMDEISRTYDVEYYDFSNHPMYTPMNQYFVDSHHLNTVGGTAFSAALRSAMATTVAMRR